MTPLLDYLATLGTWNWLIAAVVLCGFEFVVPGVHFIWFGLAAALTAAVISLLSGFGLGDLLSLPVQLLMFIGLSILCLFVVKRLGVSSSAKTDNPALNVRGAQYIGREVIVEDAIVAGRGRVRIDDSIWGAQGEDAKAGAMVTVTGVNGTVLVVENSSAND